MLEQASMEARRKAAWNEVRDFWARLQRNKATMEQDPQPRLAAEFFDSFLSQPDTQDGRIALNNAFMMWGNTTSVDAVTDALAKLDPSADYWGSVWHGAVNAYARSDRWNDVIALLHHYDALLTHPKSHSGLWSVLGRHYLHAGDTTSATDFYEKVVNVLAVPRDVLEAEGALYEIKALATGQPAPQFEARTIDGDIVRLADYLGRVVCLDFWETTCGPCWGEFAALRSLRDEFGPEVFQLIGISSDRDEEKLRDVMNSEKLTWPQIREEVGWQGDLVVFGQLRKLFNVWGVPRTVLVDQKGRIAGKDLRGDKLVAAVRGLV